MSGHEQYRRGLLANPSNREPELETHPDDCEACRVFSVQVQKFEQKLALALNISLPNGAKILHVRATRSPFKSNRWFALAASVVTVFVLAGGIWLGTPQSSLAADVVAHMAKEPEARNTHAAVPTSDLTAALKHANMTLDPKTSVSYANACGFRGNVVPHLVVQTPQGPVTVMVLIHESVARQEEFDEQGYRGTLVPIPRHGPKRYRLGYFLAISHPFFCTAYGRTGSCGMQLIGSTYGLFQHMASESKSTDFESDFA